MHIFGVFSFFAVMNYLHLTLFGFGCGETTTRQAVWSGRVNSRMGEGRRLLWTDTLDQTGWFVPCWWQSGLELQQISSSESHYVTCLRDQQHFGADSYFAFGIDICVYIYQCMYIYLYIHTHNNNNNPNPYLSNILYSIWMINVVMGCYFSEMFSLLQQYGLHQSQPSFSTSCIHEFVLWNLQFAIREQTVMLRVQRQYLKMSNMYFDQVHSSAPRNCY